MFFLTACLVLVAAAWGGHTLTAQDQTAVLKGWLDQHHQYRLATDKDCDCAGDIEQMKTGYRGLTKPVRDYHPYVATGDFNGDGVEDFAVVLLYRFTPRRKRRTSLLSCSTALSNRRRY